ncbi:hypothetical protein MalM25_36130 [Planctomycetes bacterium MalM25]|nr:hypothetical protein MalM25_36130 [Planctomycetes bacterium MalM25]
MPSIHLSLFRCCLLAQLLLALTEAPAQQVKVSISNADQIAALFPDTSLPTDAFKELDRELFTTNFHNQGRRTPGAVDYVRALITYSAPDDIRNVQSKGTTFTLSPVADYQAFVDAIDYGKVLESNEARRALKIEIDPQEIDLDKLRDRASTKGALTQFDMRFPTAGEGQATISLRNRDRDEDDLEGRLGADFEAGDHIEIVLNKKPLYGVAQRIKKGSFSSVLVEVKLSDLESFAKKVRKRSLRTRLERAGELVFWAPAERLRKLDGPPRAAHAERTWSDTTGKYQVVATYGGVEGDRVVLKKPNGKQTKVPLAKLSEADRRYVQEAQGDSNPFVASRGAGGSMRADWSGVQTIRPRISRKWKWAPPALPKPESPQVRVDSLDLSPTPGESGHSESLERLFVARDGRSAVALLEQKAYQGRNYLQRLDFAAGDSERIVECPPDSVVLDVLPEERLVLLRSEDRNATRLYLKRMESDELKPVSDFNADPPGSFHKGIDGARLLSGGRLLTYGTLGDSVIWDGARAKALHRLKFETRGGSGLELGPQGRFLFANAEGGIAIIDTETGEHVASIPHSLSSIKRISVDRRLQRLAIASGDMIITIDLRTGEMIDGFSGGLVEKGEVDFIEDLLLVDDRYLVAPKYPLLLWQYVMATSGSYDNLLTVHGGRMWYVARTGGSIDGAWSVASAETPHTAIRDKLAELGDLDELVILSPGDRVVVSADTDLPADQETRVYDAVVSAFKQSGYLVVDESAADASAKQAVVTCKRAAKPIEVLIANPKAKPPADNPQAFKPPRGFAVPSHRPAWFGAPGGSTNWMYEKHTVTPYNSSVTIRQGDSILWSDRAEIQPGQSFSPTAKGSVQDVLNMLSKPDLKRLEEIVLPGRICRSGPVGGGYGATLLDADGVLEDYLGEEE